MSDADLRKELDQLRNKLNELIDSHNKMQVHLEHTRTLWALFSSAPWVRFWMWIRPLNFPLFIRETVYPLRVNRERAPTLPPLSDVPPQMYDAEENARKRVPVRPRKAKAPSLAQIAASVRDNET